MATNRKRIPAKPVSDPVDDTPAYLTDWVSQLARCVPKRELRDLATQYGRIARTKSTPATDRRIARGRERAIRAKIG